MQHVSPEKVEPEAMTEIRDHDPSDEPDPLPDATDLAEMMSRSLSIVPVPSPPGEPPDPRRSDVDGWGRSEHMRSIARRLYDPVYRHWFRAEWDGLEKIPEEGGALLVANHAGAIPADAPAIMHGIESEIGRPVYGLADYFFRNIPVVGTMWSRTGGVPAHPDNAYRLLHDERQLALVFPEGTKATSKTYADRYRLRRFGRGGFIEIAMRAGVPIYPIAVVGAEESMPIVFRLGGLAKMLKLPYFPVTVNSLLLGPIGYVTYFPVKMKMRVLDPISFDIEPGLDRYSRSRVMDEAEKVRARLQEALARHAPRASQHLVRLSGWVAASSSPGSTPSGAAGSPRPSSREPDDRDDPRPRDRPPEGPARAHRVRAIRPAVLDPQPHRPGHPGRHRGPHVPRDELHVGVEHRPPRDQRDRDAQPARRRRLRPGRRSARW